jgi:hypothetical protein
MNAATKTAANTKTAALLLQSIYTARGDEVGAHVCQRALDGDAGAAEAVGYMITEELEAE